MIKIALSALFIFSSPVIWSENLPPKQIRSLKITTLDEKKEIIVGGKSDKVYLINFWATWCGPCKQEMPLLENFYQTHKSDGLEVIAISMDNSKNLDEVKEFAKSFSFLISHKSKSNIKELGEIWRLPSTFVIDKNGLLQKNGRIGEAVVTSEDLERILLPLLNQP